MPPALLALPIAEWIIVSDLPDSGLCAATLPVARLAFAYGVEAIFMAPMIMATTQRMILLDPHYLSA
jgi:hypothetical protein